MSMPVVPVAVTNPVGWAVLGVAGYVTYKVGKKSGLKGEQDIDTPSLGDRAVKGAMKSVYKTQKFLGEAFSKTGEKYSSLWKEAREEVG